MWKQGLLGAVVISAAILVAGTANAGHFTHWVLVGAPYTGQWSTFEHPGAHHHPYGGDWGMDHLSGAGPFTEGRLYISNNFGHSTWGKIEDRKPSCANPALWAGEYYRIGLYDAALGYRGWVVMSHFTPYSFSDPWNPNYYSVGATVFNGAVLGWTEFWGNGNHVGTCYQVSVPQHSHWHVEMDQGAHAYSCFFPYSTGQTLAASTTLGAVGANATQHKASCW